LKYAEEGRGRGGDSTGSYVSCVRHIVLVDHYSRSTTAHYLLTRDSSDGKLLFVSHAVRGVGLTLEMFTPSILRALTAGSLRGYK
jgi:hypothetical protein